MRKQLRIAATLAMLGFTAFSNSATAQRAFVEELTVLSVRAYVEGNTLIDFSQSIGNTCGEIVGHVDWIRFGPNYGPERFFKTDNSREALYNAEKNDGFVSDAYVDAISAVVG